jgi:hypothetical protein
MFGQYLVWNTITGTILSMVSWVLPHKLPRGPLHRNNCYTKEDRHVSEGVDEISRQFEIDSVSVTNRDAVSWYNREDDIHDCADNEGG